MKREKTLRLAWRFVSWSSDQAACLSGLAPMACVCTGLFNSPRDGARLWPALFRPRWRSNAVRVISEATRSSWVSICTIGAAILCFAARAVGEAVPSVGLARGSNAVTRESCLAP